MSRYRTHGRRWQSAAHCCHVRILARLRHLKKIMTSQSVHRGWQPKTHFYHIIIQSLFVRLRHCEQIYGTNKQHYNGSPQHISVILESRQLKRKKEKRKKRDKVASLWAHIWCHNLCVVAKLSCCFLICCCLGFFQIWQHGARKNCDVMRAI